MTTPLPDDTNTYIFKHGHVLIINNLSTEHPESNQILNDLKIFFELEVHCNVGIMTDAPAVEMDYELTHYIYFMTESKLFFKKKFMLDFFNHILHIRY